LALSGIRLALPAFTILFALENNLSDGTEVEHTDRYFLAKFDKRGKRAAFFLQSVKGVIAKSYPSSNVVFLS
jgi:hypothetical protein